MQQIQTQFQQHPFDFVSNHTGCSLVDYSTPIDLSEIHVGYFISSTPFFRVDSIIRCLQRIILSLDRTFSSSTIRLKNIIQ